LREVYTKCDLQVQLWIKINNTLFNISQIFVIVIIDTELILKSFFVALFGSFILVDNLYFNWGIIQKIAKN